MKPVFADVPEGIYNPALPYLGRGEGATLIAQIIANALKVIFAISGVVLLAMLISGGIQWMTAGGDKEAMVNAKKRLTSALIGFAIFICVFAIINFLLPALGITFDILEITWPTPESPTRAPMK